MGVDHSWFGTDSWFRKHISDRGKNGFSLMGQIMEINFIPSETKGKKESGCNRKVMTLDAKFTMNFLEMKRLRVLPQPSQHPDIKTI